MPVDTINRCIFIMVHSQNSDIYTFNKSLPLSLSLILSLSLSIYLSRRICLCVPTWRILLAFL